MPPQAESPLTGLSMLALDRGLRSRPSPLTLAATPKPVAPRAPARPSLAAAAAHEAAGTFFVVFAATASANAADAAAGPLVSGAGVALGMLAAGSVSGAHLNPAVSLALALFAGFPWRRLPAYAGAQLAGAALAALCTAALYGPGATLACSAAASAGAPGPAAAREALGTAVLLFAIWALSKDPRNRAAPGLMPAAIGLLITSLGVLVGPLTMACFNPARDAGPRLVGWALSSSSAAAAASAQRGWWAVYGAAPCAGAVLGAFAGKALEASEGWGGSAGRAAAAAKGPEAAV